MPIANLALVFAPTLFALSAVSIASASDVAASADSNAALVVAELIGYHAAMNVVPSHLVRQLRRVTELKRERRTKPALARCRLERVSKRADSAGPRTGPQTGSVQIRVLVANTYCNVQISAQSTVCDVLTQLGTRCPSLPSRRDLINADLVQDECCRHVLSETGEPDVSLTSRRASNQTAAPNAQHSCAHALTRASSALFTPLSMSIAKPNASGRRSLWLFEAGGNLLDSRRLDPEACILEVYLDNNNAEWCIA